MSDAARLPDDDWELWRRFRRMFGNLERALEDRLQDEAGVSRADFNIMIVLFDAPDRRLRSGRLAEIMLWEKSRVSHQLARLEQRGLIRRDECDDDLRGKWVSLTNDGRRAILAALRPHNAAIREHFLDLLSDRDKQVIGSVATRVLDTLDDDGFPADRPAARPPSRKSA